MKSSKNAISQSRAAVKRALRKDDRIRLEKGANPEGLQRNNSIFPKDFFKDAHISNFGQSIGR